MGAQIVEIPFVADDRLPELFVTFNQDGAPVDISAFTSITLRIRKPDNTLLIKTAVIDDGPAGKFHFEWDVGDLTQGNFESRIKFEVTPGVTNSIPKANPMILAVTGQV